MAKQITNEMVNDFLNGRDPMKHIISMECAYNEDMVNIIFVDDKGVKRVRQEEFRPFLWAKNSACIRLFQGNRGTLRRKMREYGISVKALITKNDGGEESERIYNGYKYMFFAAKKMTYTRFLSFFGEAGVPVYDKASSTEMGGSNKEYLVVSPIEQHMIRTGKRLFKGYEGYDELTRLLFDIETQGLNPKIHAIDQIGIRTNKGFKKIITITGEGEERRKNELLAIREFVSIIAEIKPDVIAGHNSENFDWDFIIVRCEVLGTTFKDVTSEYFKYPIYKKKKEAVLKLGGEMEYYRPTVAWGFNILDSLHAVRRAQALDSNMKSASLKYATQYLDLKKPNRVYVPGNQITTIWNVTEPSYAFNDADGDWYLMGTEKPLRKDYKPVSGRYIVERYLLDDIWETDKVELKLNESNFLVSKILPTSFTRACTMGTAGIWKLIMLAWCYENNLAVPAADKNRKFTGGLSRLLKTGYVDRIVKLDYNSLYPSIDLTWWVKTDLDIDNIMLYLLEYILTNREKYKELKAIAGEKANELSEKLKTFEGSEEEKAKIKEEIQRWKAEKMGNDKKQLPLKILANSFFGSYGCPQVFPFGDLRAAEKTTCIGRQSLRLMISHFTGLGYTPVVGDSFLGDTPVFIKYNHDGLIDIKPISEIVDESNIHVDLLGREYDYSEKPYKVLCRSGWVSPSYVYRHKTSKPIYEVRDGDGMCEVTEDHSLFNSRHEKIKPSKVNENTELEYHTWYLESDGGENYSDERLEMILRFIEMGRLDRLPIGLLNADSDTKKRFVSVLDLKRIKNPTKTLLAGIKFIGGKI